MVRKIIKMCFGGITFGCFVMTVITMIFAVASGQAGFSISTGSYIRSAVCSMVVGMGFLVPTIVYSNDALPMGMRILIHMGIGLAVYFICAFIAGWIPVDLGVGTMVVDVLLVLAVSWVIWFVCYSCTRREAKRINERIKGKR